MTRFLAFAILFCFSVTGRIFAEQSHSIAVDGRTDYQIVLPEKPTPVEQTAAKELQLHLEAVTGAEFPVVREPQTDASKPAFFVGDSETVRNMLVDVDPLRLPYDAIVRRSVGNDIVLVGHPQRGSLYAVYTLLEEAVGVRWWTSTESFIPKKPSLDIPFQNVRYAPKLIYREAYYRDVFKSVFASRLKYNGNYGRIAPEYGGHFIFCHFVHSFFKFLPPEKYFAKHPEWYAEIDGKRKHVHTQLCLSNDEMRAELTRNVLRELRNNPKAKFVSVSQNDNTAYCQCKSCTEIAEKEESQSGPVLHFVNKVAEDVEKEFPDVWVETLAYQYTRKPPKYVRPRQNVVIRLCTIECSFAQSLGRSEQNEKFREDIEAWSNIADLLFIWDYTTNFSSYMLPHPNLRVLGPNIRFFVDHKTIGLYEQGDSYCSAGDFVRLKNWVLSQMMWNPSRDAQALIDEFIDGYYGSDAGPLVKEYWKLLLDKTENSDVYLDCFRTTTQDWLDGPALKQASELMNNVVAAAKDETYRNRLRRDKLPIDFVLLKDYHAMRRRSALTGEPFLGPENLGAAWDDFFARCKEFGVKAFRESDTPEQFRMTEQGLRQKVGTPAPIPEFCTSLPSSSWFDVEEFEFTCNKPGEQTFVVDDPNASNGRAVKMPGNHREWATSYAFDQALLELKPIDSKKTSETPKYRLYAAVRCEATKKEGRAMTIGVYDVLGKRIVTHKHLSVPEINDSEYRWIDMGDLPLKPRFYVWFEPPNRPADVNAVYVDRIVVVRTK